MAGVEKRFLQYGTVDHLSSTGKNTGHCWGAVEAQALGTAEPKSLLVVSADWHGQDDSGSPKSMKALVWDPAYQQVRIVRIRQSAKSNSPRLIEEIGMSKDQFAVRTGVDNQELNSLGRNDHPNAQVLWTDSAETSSSAALPKLRFVLERRMKPQSALRTSANTPHVQWNAVLRRFEEQKVIEELRRRGIEAAGPDRKSDKGMVHVFRLR